MKFIPLHTKNTAIVYKNALCSTATIIVLTFIILSVMIPVFLVSLLSPYSGIAESQVLYEQPFLSFQFQSIFIGETSDSNGLIVCSTFPSFNERMDKFEKSCDGYKYWSEDVDYDDTIDRAHFQLQLDDNIQRVKSFDLTLFFDAKLKHKCTLTPPALLTHHMSIPVIEQMMSGTIHLKAELQLKQNIEFTCPFPGRNTKTHFRQVAINTNLSSSFSALDIEQFRQESLIRQLKSNPAYFKLNVDEIYLRRDRSQGLKILLDIDILQVPARYHLSVWERLGQFWLYFASFFGISLYVMNKFKDFLFGRHIIRSWEIIPWKKLY